MRSTGRGGGRSPRDMVELEWVRLGRGHKPDEAVEAIPARMLSVMNVRPAEWSHAGLRDAALARQRSQPSGAFPVECRHDDLAAGDLLSWTELVEPALEERRRLDRAEPVEAVRFEGELLRRTAEEKRLDDRCAVAVTWRSDGRPCGERSLSMAALTGRGCWRALWQQESRRRTELRVQTLELRLTRRLLLEAGPAHGNEALRGGTVALELVTKHLDWVRTLSPAEDRALRAVKAGEADEEQQATCLAMLNAARDADRWILCDCQEEEGLQAVVVPVRRTRSLFALSNRPKTQEPHAEDCVFARGKAGGGGGGRSSVFDDNVRPVHGRREACRRARPAGAGPVGVRGARARPAAAHAVRHAGRADGRRAPQHPRGCGRVLFRSAMAGRDRTRRRSVPAGAGRVHAGIPVHRPGRLALGRGRAQARGRRIQLARAPSAVRPALLDGARRGRDRDQPLLAAPRPCRGAVQGLRPFCLAKPGAGTLGCSSGSWRAPRTGGSGSA